MDIWRGLRLIRSRPWFFVVGCLLGFVLALVVPRFATKPMQVFRSTAKILITPNSSGNVDPGVKTWFVDENTIRVLLSSQDLLDVVLESVGSKISWLELRDRIEVDVLSQGGNVSLLEVKVLGTKPEEVRLMTQALCEKFIQYVQQLSAGEHDKTVAYLERERRNIEREMARSQQRLLKLNFFPANSSRSNSIEDSWVQLQAQRAEYEKDLALAKAEMEQYSLDPEESGDPTGRSSRSFMQDTVDKERLELAKLREVFNDRSPQVQEQTRKLKQLESVQVAEQSKIQNVKVAVAQKKVTRLSALLAQTEARLKALERKRPGPEKQFEYANEDRQLQMWQESYLAITRQLYNARALQQSSRREGAFTIVEKPQTGKLVAGQVVSRSMAVQILFAIPIGLVAGLALVMGSDYLNSSLRLEPRIEEAMGLPILGSIPNIAEETSTGWDHMKNNLKRSQSLE